MEHKGSLDKALTLLETVAQLGSAGQRQLAHLLGFSPSTAYRLLSVLVARGYLLQEGETKKYRLSMKMLDVASTLRDEMDIVRAARPAMRELMETCGETVNLVIYDQEEAIYVDQVVNTGSMLRMFTRVGARAPLYCTGVGKAFLAQWRDAEVVEYFQEVEKASLTPRTILELPVLLEQLAQVRRRGYSVDDQEKETGVRCVAAVITSDGSVRGGLSISGPSGRVGMEDTDRLGQLVKQATERIGTGLAQG